MPRKLAPDLAYVPGSRPYPYNIVLIVIDDLRADHLSAYGYERRTSPRLESRLDTATLFTQCHSPVGWTLPACASIITGQLPEHHGLVDHNRRFCKPKLGHYLGEQYYRIGIANNGNVVTDKLSRERLEGLGLKRRPAKWRFFNWDDGFDRYEWVAREDHMRPYELACDFLDSQRQAERPYFLFFHSNLVHDYHMDREYYLDGAEWIGEPIHPALRAVKDGPEIWRSPPPGLGLAEVKRHLVAKYDAGIRTMDSKLDEVFRRIDLETTIVAMLSDHGEGFEPEVGRVHHCGRLHCDLTRVPLLLWLPPALRAQQRAPSRVDAYCSSIDLAPTLLALLGDAVSGFPGRHLFDLATHRTIEGVDRGYVYWNEDCVRESYDTCRIELRSRLTYPLKEIEAQKNDCRKHYAYNLAYDPLERDNLAAPLRPRIESFEPITFVVAVNDEDELAHNLLASPVARSPHHEWLLVPNRGNERYSSISRLYAEAAARAANDLIFFVHQDVHLPHGWEERVFRALAELEERDPRWGVLGAVGATARVPGRPKELKGHWCDPSGYYRSGPLPHEVQSLDEQWLGVRRSSGVAFDPELPGFHCYGIDLSLQALELGRKSYAIDCFVWHKLKDSNGHLITRREDSAKIRARWSDSFMTDFQPSAEHVRRKWRKHLPFQTTSWNWDAD